MGEDEFARHPIGSGPYTYASGDTKEVRLTVNPEYWGKPAHAQDVVIKHIPDDRQYQALLDGTVDVVQGLTAEQFEQLENNPDFNTYVGHSNLYHFLGMDVRREQTPTVDFPHNPFRDKRVRLAIAKTLDLDEINHRVFRDRAAVASQLGNSGVFGFNSDIHVMPRNIEDARELMNATGYEEGFSVTLHTPLGARVRVAEVIAEQLQAINIRVTVVPVVDKQFWQEIFQDEHSYSFFLAGFSVGQTVEHTLKSLFATKNQEGLGRINFTGHSNPEVDAYLERAAYSNNTEEKLQYLQTVNRLVMDDKPVIPLYSMPKLYGLTPRVDWNPRFTSEMRVEDVKLIEKKGLIDSLKEMLP